MMPFILSYDFGDSELPEYLRPYWKFIERCSVTEDAKNSLGRGWFSKDSSEIGKVCYLTIQESMVESGESQRRPGLHVDCPGSVKIREPSSKATRRESGGEEKWATSSSGGEPKNPSTSEGKEGDGKAKRYRDHHWGLGGCYFVPPQPQLEGIDKNADMRSFEIRGGIFMASSVGESCKAWNCKIVPEEGEEEEGKNSKTSDKDNADKGDDTNDKKSNQSRGREAIGKLGNIKHLRHLLPEELAQVNRL